MNRDPRPSVHELASAVTPEAAAELHRQAAALRFAEHIRRVVGHDVPAERVVVSGRGSSYDVRVILDDGSDRLVGSLGKAAMGAAVDGLFAEAGIDGRTIDLAVLHERRREVESFARRQGSSWTRILDAVAGGQSRINVRAAEGGRALGLRHGGATMSLGVFSDDELRDVLARYRADDGDS